MKCILLGHRETTVEGHGDAEGAWAKVCPECFKVLETGGRRRDGKTMDQALAAGLNGATVYVPLSR